MARLLQLCDAEATAIMIENSNSNQSLNESPVRQKPSFWLPILGAGVIATGGYAAWQGSQSQSQADQLRRQVARSEEHTSELQSLV